MVSSFCSVPLWSQKDPTPRAVIANHQELGVRPWETLLWFFSPLANLKAHNSLPLKATGDAVGEICFSHVISIGS